MSLHQWMERMWWKSAAPPAPLRWMSHIYAGVNNLNLRRRTRHATNPPVPLISVGNITVGGSGKTPFVIWLCGQLRQRGYRPVVLCRGDGGRLNRPRVVQANDSADEVGDEALLLAQCSDTPVIAGRDRVAAGGMVSDLGDIMILDDGFQYRQLGRACDILLVPAEGIGNGRLLPAGPLREPVSSLARADLIVRTGNGPAAPLSQAREWRWQALSPGLRQIQGVDTPTPEKAVAVCAIARPQRFFNALMQQGVEVAERMVFPDHYRYRPNDVKRITRRALSVVTTEKDAVKLAAMWPDEQSLWVLPIEGAGEEGLPDAIIQTILSHLARTIHKSP